MTYLHEVCSGYGLISFELFCTDYIFERKLLFDNTTMDDCGSLRPPVVDDTTDPGVLKEYIKEKLMAATINPHFKVRVPRKFLEAKAECLAKVETFYKLVDYKGKDSCVSCNLKEEWECTKKLRSYFDTVRTKITTAMFGLVE